MKKLLALLCLIALLMAAIVPCVASAEYHMWVKVSKGSTVNTREGPGKEYEFVRKLDYGTEVIVLEDRNGWSLCEPVDPHLLSNPKWIQSCYLVNYNPGKKPTPSPDPTPTDDKWNAVAKAAKAIKYLDEPYTAVIKTKNQGAAVHLRWFPDTSAPWDDAIYTGDEILVMAESKSWAQVQVVETGHVGFIVQSVVNAAMDE